MSAAPTVFLSVSDSHLTVHACAACQAIHIQVTAPKQNLSSYTIQEDQTGNTVHFSLREKKQAHMLFEVHVRSPNVEVTVELPADVTLNATASDGAITASGLHGTLSIETADGSQTLDNLNGTIKLRASDGSVRAHQCAGTVDAHTTDAALEISGVLTALQVQSTDGSATIQLLPGSHLTANSDIRVKDGGANVKVPKDLAADFDILMKDGDLESSIPLVLDGYNRGSNRNELHGKLNGGGPLLTIRGSDGKLVLSTL